jgi:hypothetical protein
MATSEQASMRISDRVQKTGLQFGFSLILFILPMLSRLLGCLTDNDDVSSETAQDRVLELHEKDPARLLKRTTKAVLRHAKKEHKVLSKEQAQIIAQAIIDEMIECDRQECCATLASMQGDIQ